MPTEPAVADRATDEPAPPRNDPASHATRFFEALFDSAPADHHALLWTLPDKKSTWVPLRHGVAGLPDCVTERALTLANAGRDVYCAVSLAEKAGLHDTRIRTENSAGIMGLWADIDIAAPDVHKKWNLPPTEEAALDVLDRTQMPPTLIVHSGHGLQAWWLFNEFWAFDAEAPRLEAYGLAERWNGTLRTRAGEAGQAHGTPWVVDSTFDLARVMRVPGTLNRKGTPVMPVRLMVDDGPRYNPDDFDRYMVDVSVLAERGITPTRSYVPDADLVIDEAMTLDFERVQALIDNGEKFKDTWDMKRKDFDDQSPSSYDLALVGQAARVGWSDQELAALIYQFRRRHKLDVAKALRKDYVLRTITKARDRIAREGVSDSLEELGEALAEAKASGDDEKIRESRRGACDGLSLQLGFELLHFIKYMSDPPAYAAVTPTKTIPLGDADGILQWGKFRRSVWESIGHQIDRFKAPAWDQITAFIPSVCEEQDVGAEATDRGEVQAWLAQYLAQRPPVDTQEEAVSSEYPFLDDQGRTVLFGPAFKRWLYITYQERISNQQLGKRLRAFGCEPDKVNMRQAGKPTSRGVWRLPVGAVS